MIKHNDPCTECTLNWDVHTSSMKAACRAKRVARITTSIAMHEECGKVVTTALTHDARFLLAEVARLQRLTEDQNDQITRLQIESNRRLDEERGLRKLDATPGLDVALKAVVAERYRQDNKFGPIAHLLDVPDGTGSAESRVFVTIAKDACDRSMKDGTFTFAKAYEEEVAEVLSESDPAALRAELIQSAAFSIKWVQIIDAREAGK